MTDKSQRNSEMVTTRKWSTIKLWHCHDNDDAPDGRRRMFDDNNRPAAVPWCVSLHRQRCTLHYHKYCFCLTDLTHCSHSTYLTGSHNTTLLTNRKHRQSYRHADPRRKQQHTTVAACVTSNRANVTVFVTAWPWPFDLWVNAYQATAIEYMWTKFGVDCSNRFPVRVRTNRQTQMNALATPVAIQPAWVITKQVCSQSISVCFSSHFSNSNPHQLVHPLHLSWKTTTFVDKTFILLQRLFHFSTSAIK